MKKEGIELQEIVLLLKKKIWLIILITVSITGLVGIYGFKVKKPYYTGTVKIFSGKNVEAQDYTTNEIESNVVLMNTYIELIKTDDFMNTVIDKVGIDTGPDSLKAAVKFTTDGKTPILTISYNNEDKDVARSVTEAISESFETEVKETILNINTKVIEKVKVIENIPNKTNLILLGMGAGLILSIGIILVLDFFDNRIKNKDELEKLIEIPILAELPKEKELLKSGGK